MKTPQKDPLTTFNNWLSTLLSASEADIDKIMSNETALQFLIAWSLFESKCFKGKLEAGKLRGKADEFTKEGLQPRLIAKQAEHFHKRYRGTEGALALENLVHEREGRTPTRLLEDFKLCLSKSWESLSDNDQVFVVTFVVYRYRNNMFHGSKGVQSWLRYGPQIKHCIAAMQAFISHVEQ